MTRTASDRSSRRSSGFMLGRRAEALAASFFAGRGYRLLARNYRAPCGEIDLILEQESEVVFVEVKARTSNRFGLPQEAVTPRKQHQVIRTSQWFLQERGWLDRPVRFDVLSIQLPRHGEPVFEHIPGAFGG